MCDLQLSIKRITTINKFSNCTSDGSTEAMCLMTLFSVSQPPTVYQGLQMTGDLTSTCEKTEMKYHPANKEVTAASLA